MANQKSKHLQLPYNYIPRDYQLPFLQAFDDNINNGLGKIRKFILVWHRRSGKEKTIINVCAKQMEHRVGSYYYFFPSFTQGKKILWDGMDKDGFKFLSHFPKEILAGKPNDTEMKLKYTNGSIFQVIGTDNIDSVVGTNPIGCVFSEYALQDPRAWDYVRPILAENGGWAIFNFTPRGNNHGKAIKEQAEGDKENFYCEVLTVDDTKCIPPYILAQERKEIIKQHGNDALYQQEYMCSFETPVEGSYYGNQIRMAQSEGRITRVAYDPAILVDTWWDLGVGDSMAIWYTQSVGNEVRAIDYDEFNGEGLDYCAKRLKEKNYVYGEHTAPHDIEVRELSTGKTRRELAAGLGINFNVAPKLPIDDGISACRIIFPRIWFDEKKCERGLDALKSYHKEYDEQNKCYKDRPHHNWASHGADSFRTFGVGYKERVFSQEEQTPTQRLSENPKQLAAFNMAR